jgi:hypothetical protein
MPETIQLLLTLCLLTLFLLSVVRNTQFVSLHTT